MLAEELQFAGGVRDDKLLQEQPAEQGRENLYREEVMGPAGDPTFTVERESATRHNHVDMRMMVERRTPGMEDGEEADAGAEVAGVGRDRQHRLRRSLKQQIVDHGFILIGDVGNPS